MNRAAPDKLRVAHRAGDGRSRRSVTCARVAGERAGSPGHDDGVRIVPAGLGGPDTRRAGRAGGASRTGGAGRTFVFAAADGRGIDYRSVGKEFGSAIEAAHLNYHHGRLTLHSYALLLIASGLNVVFVSRQLGHANPT
jgi:hypothetical protein